MEALDEAKQEQEKIPRQAQLIRAGRQAVTES